MKLRKRIKKKTPRRLALRDPVLRQKSASSRQRERSDKDPENTIDHLKRELGEALDHQAATAEVLKIISSSAGALDPVFRTILANATRLCGAKFGTFYLREGNAFRAAAFHNAPPAFIEDRKNRLIEPASGSTLGRAAKTKQAAQILDSTKREAYRQGDPFVVAGADLGGYRTIVSVPMLKEDELVGVISIYRQEVLAFSDKQVELVSNFAAQAVIAIENTRLLNELRESLQQQTATADVLKVISSSPGDLQPVFDSMLANATRLCQASYGHMWLCEGNAFRTVALHGALPAANQWQSGALFHGGPDVPSVHAVRTRQPSTLPIFVRQKPTLTATNWRALAPTSQASAHWSPCRCSRRMSRSAL